MLEEKDVGKEYLVGTTIPCLLHCNWMVPKLNYYGEKLNSSTSLQDKTKPLAILEKELSLESNYAFSRGRNYQGQAPSPRSLPTMSKESRGRSQKIEKKTQKPGCTWALLSIDGRPLSFSSFSQTRATTTVLMPN